MDTFKLYFSLGREHILNYTDGYDHILFIVALCVIYLLRDWKNILVMVTSFTIGHSITLILVTLHIIHVNPKQIEFLIPITIFITSCIHIFHKKPKCHIGFFQKNYVLASLFGLIHGVGFSTYLQAVLGKTESIIVPLLAFNLGVELGQIVIVLGYLIISHTLVGLFGISRYDWQLGVSSAIAGIALVLAKQNIFW